MITLFNNTLYIYSSEANKYPVSGQNCYQWSSYAGTICVRIYDYYAQFARHISV